MEIKPIKINQTNAVSPLTGSNNIKLIYNLSTKIIVAKYKLNYNIDVSKYFATEEISLYECLDTGFRFYYPFNIEGDDLLYERLQQNEGYYSTWNWEHEVAFNRIKPKDKVLEVGCGIGNFLQKLSENNIHSTGLELNTNAINICKKKNLNVYHEMLDEHNMQHKGYYDVVCCFQVLEHIKDPSTFIKECLKSVRLGGTIIFGVPNSNPYIYKRDKLHTLNLPPHHMGLWNKKVFLKLTNYYKLNINELLINELIDVRYYFNLILETNSLGILKPLCSRIPEKIIRELSKINKWEGRDLLAIFTKT
jgi:2-polyprenyl-3-methyl-5-hydroxy-6-metoxy-1,4-benzoquinol methylase